VINRSDVLVCPETKVPLRLATLEEAGPLAAPHGQGLTAVGPTPTVLLREDGAGAYPVVDDGIPVLRAPEMLVPGDVGRRVDVRRPQYAEAYEEMEHYDRTARDEAASVASSRAALDLGPLAGMTEEQRMAFPRPVERWLDAKYELAAQFDAFSHLAPMTGRSVLQIGGRGLHAVRFLLAGAAEAWVASPMVGELVFAQALAKECGVADRLHCVAALAEELPFRDGTFDAVYSQGCVHHWLMPLALPECARVLRPGGKFAAVEPWRGPLYGLGTKILGKRDPKVRCVVLTQDRIQEPLESLGDARIVHHGALSRYPLLALWKAGVKPRRSTVWRIGRWDDALTHRLPRLRETGSSVAILGTVQARQAPVVAVR
jgi:SAM-dependent methyltransferase/uncharacterized protein YbaR (Trm112 family)